MYLYIVNYTLFDTHENENDEGIWLFGAENHVELEKEIELKFEEMAQFGYNKVNYGYQRVEMTENFHDISIKRRNL